MDVGTAWLTMAVNYFSGWKYVSRSKHNNSYCYDVLVDWRVCCPHMLGGKGHKLSIWSERIHDGRV